MKDNKILKWIWVAIRTLLSVGICAFATPAIPLRVFIAV